MKYPREALMRIPIFVATFVFSLSSAGQQPESTRNESAGSSGCSALEHLCIRVENTTGIDFDIFEVRFPGQVEDFGTLRAGEISAYRRIDRSYDHAWTEAVSDGRVFVLVVIDHLGERFLPPGNYTLRYRVRVLDEPVKGLGLVLHGYLGSELEVDECRLTSSCSGP